MKTLTTTVSAVIVLLPLVPGGAVPQQQTNPISTAQVTGDTLPVAATTIPVTQAAMPTVSPGGPVDGTSATAANYAIDWSSLNGGGTTNASSPNYKLGASIGQSAAGSASSASYQMGIGFWYGVPSVGSCQCDCHADPLCDGIRNNVQDVVLTVNVAFRGAAAMPDPNNACPYETTDTNCSGSTDVVDAVKIVNVAFRGANPATEFCDPCP